MPFNLEAIIAEYVTTPGFGLTCAAVFVVSAALYEDIIPDFADKYKRLTAVVIGAVLALFLIQMDITGFIVGAIAGFTTTYAVKGSGRILSSAVERGFSSPKVAAALAPKGYGSTGGDCNCNCADKPAMMDGKAKDLHGTGFRKQPVSIPVEKEIE